MTDAPIRFNPNISAAIRDRDFSTFRDIMQAQPEQLKTFTPFAGGTWLHYAAREGDIEAVKLLIALGIDVNIGDAREGRGAICDAGLGGNADIVEHLIGAGARLDTSEPVRNPLFSAIIGRSLIVVQMLLDSGIDTRVRYDGTMKSMDALAFAIERGETPIAEAIARHQANGDPETVRVLLETARKVATSNNSETAP